MSKYWKILDNDDISEDAILEKNDEFIGSYWRFSRKEGHVQGKNHQSKYIVKS